MIQLDLYINRIIINGDHISAFISWQGKWQRPTQEQGDQARGQGVLLWSGNQVILLRGSGREFTLWHGGTVEHTFLIPSLSISNHSNKLHNMTPPSARTQLNDQVFVTDYLIIGAGVAGLRAAVELCRHGTVTMVAKGGPQDNNSFYAQGGVAVALSEEDDVDLHFTDTVKAGHQLCSRPCQQRP